MRTAFVLVDACACGRRRQPDGPSDDPTAAPPPDAGAQPTIPSRLASDGGVTLPPDPPRLVVVPCGDDLAHGCLPLLPRSALVALSLAAPPSTDVGGAQQHPPWAIHVPLDAHRAYSTGDLLAEAAGGAEAAACAAVYASPRVLSRLRGTTAAEGAAAATAGPQQLPLGCGGAEAGVVAVLPDAPPAVAAVAQRAEALGPLARGALARYGSPPPPPGGSRLPDLRRFYGWAAPVRLDTSWVAEEPSPSPACPPAHRDPDTDPAAGTHQPAPPPPLVAVLGGSFSPPTLAHTAVAAAVLGCSPAVGAVWVVPCGARPDKPTLAVPPTQRWVLAVAAVEAAFPGDHRVAVAPLELWTPAALPSYVLLGALAREEPAAGFALVIGADLLPDLPRWRHAQALLRETRFLLVPRPGYAPGGGGTPPLPDHLTPVTRPDGAPVETPDVSSTAVRDAVAAAHRDAAAAGTGYAGAPSQLDLQRRLDGMVAPPVAALIAALGLYAPARD